MKTMRSFAALMLVVLLLPVLSACGPAAVDVTLETYKLTMSSTTAPAGEITFHVINKAADQEHEFVIFRTDLPADQMPMNAEGNVDENGAGVTHVDEIQLAAGTSGDLKVTLDKGNYVMICNIPENHHYTQGMYVAFTVK